MRSSPLRAFAIALAVMVSACLKSTEPQASVLDLKGSWSYTAVQSSPVPETLTGTLTISRESGTSFQGRVDLVGVNSQSGESRLLSGLVSGSASGNDVIDFDADVDGTPRRHVGQIVADTIAGTWVGSSSGGPISTGTFRVERETR
ncbi:MAG: hypothetical protein ACJ794_12980 [Gemmatimonadaceae bacterium]